MMKRESGFTLIELSIVLVIIGFIVGGIFVGRDLINAAASRAQIAQIEKYHSAVNTFKNKYGGLPGDLPSNLATQFGFIARGTNQGQGDGNGIIQGWGGQARASFEGAGETVVFWVDLSAVGLIDGSFTTANETTLAGSDVTGSSIGLYLPPARIGNGAYVYVWNTTSVAALLNPYPDNWYGVSAVTDIASSAGGGKVASAPAISPVQAYNMDKKMDDGMPLSGSVQVMGLGPTTLVGDPYWSVTNASNWGGWDEYHSVAPNGSLSVSAGSCIDNGGNAANPITYSLSASANGGIGLNCALSFKFE